MDGNCGDCHLGTQIDWTALGWSGDPANGVTAQSVRLVEQEYSAGVSQVVALNR